MTISKKLFLIVAMGGLMGSAVNASVMTGFDFTLLNPLIARSKEAIEAVASALNSTRSACPDAKAFAKNLYTQQKNALKVIKTELKQAYKAAKLENSSSWFTKRQLYKAYKKLVYKSWKKTRLFTTF